MYSLNWKIFLDIVNNKQIPPNTLKILIKILWLNSIIWLGKVGVLYTLIIPDLMSKKFLEIFIHILLKKTLKY